MMAKNAERSEVRLQKFMSDAGVASRRRCEELITEGRVLVNDEIVDELPVFVDPQQDRVIVDGAVVKAQPHEYFIANKPPGVVCTRRDPSGRPRAVDLLPTLKARLNVVGRLDVDSMGLLLLTNDGELAQKVSHPRYGLRKVYQAEVRGRVKSDLADRMEAGVHLAEGKAVAESCVIKRTSDERSQLEVVLRQGRNRQIRRMLAKLGYKVKRLKRVAIGPLTVKGLPLGASRRLSSKELKALREAVAKTPTRHKARTSKPQRRGRSSRPAATPKKSSRPSSRPAAGPRKGQATSRPSRRVIE